MATGAPRNAQPGMVGIAYRSGQIKAPGDVCTDWQLQTGRQLIAGSKAPAACHAGQRCVPVEVHRAYNEEHAAPHLWGWPGTLCSARTGCCGRWRRCQCRWPTTTCGTTALVHQVKARLEAGQDINGTEAMPGWAIVG